MKIPLSLLQEFIDLSHLSCEEIASALTLSGIEVDKIENEKATFSNVVSALIKEVVPHPNAEKLQIAKVFDGKDTYQVVCGAINCREGLKSAFAKEGSTLLHDGKKVQIKKCKLRNVESFGMLCSEKELNLANESEGIIELDQNIELGKDLTTVLIDPIFEISLTPNLGHVMSIIGVARELAAILNKTVKKPHISFHPILSISTNEKIKVETDPKLCPIYCALYIENIQVGPSPSWLKKRLELCNFHSVNNIVDIMNYVMLELGQPLHAFDFDKLEGKKISVGPSKKEQTFLGLDKIERKLPHDSLVIKDEKKILAVAGIMGAESSSIDQNTTKILIESALFDPISIRKTSRQINLRSESSQRFEKRVDSSNLIFVLKRVAHLIEMIIPSAKIANDFIEKKEIKIEKIKISLRISRTNQILGTKLSSNEIQAILKRLECEISKESENQIEILVPLYRNDLKEEIDLIEEVARIYGYNNIEKKSPLIHLGALTSSPIYLFEKDIQNIFISQGMQEVITCDLISPFLAKILEEKFIPKSDMIQVLHFKSEDQSILRASFLPSFLQIAQFNHYHKNFDLSIFEIGKVHFKKNDDFCEQLASALMICGKNRPHHWKEKPRDVDFYDMKGILENLFHSLKIENYGFKKSHHPCFHPQKQAAIFLNEIEIGIAGEVHPSILKEFDIKKPIFFAEMNDQYLMDHQKEDLKFKPIPSFPSSERDLTIKTTEEIDLKAIFDKIGSPLLESLFILDLYEDPKAKDNSKNITLRFVYRDKNKTISFEEVEKEHDKITKELLKKIK